jgi:carboxylate-amine ligase
LGAIALNQEISDMSPQAQEFTLGVEEEYQIIDPITRELCPHGSQILANAQETLGDTVQPEVYLSQIEIATKVCHTLAEVRSDLSRLRGAVIAAATKDGSQIAAAGTHPFSDWAKQQVTPRERYQGLIADYQQLMRDLIIFGCHVHIGVSDREIAVQVMNRARLWLSPLLALAAGSPFWQGEDTGYSSYRTELWSRWPMAGLPLAFESKADYDALIQDLISTETIKDGTKIYWDVRLSERFPTIEFRVTDVCTTIDEAVMIAGLTRALAQTCYTEVIQNQPFTDVRPEILRAAHWHAARHGITEHLIDVINKRAISADDMIDKLLNFIKPALEAQGDWDEVSQLVQHTLQHGTSADRQRQAYQRRNSMEDVVDLLVAETAKGIS